MPYLSDVLKCLPAATNFEAEALIPANWKKSKLNTRRSAAYAKSLLTTGSSRSRFTSHNFSFPGGR